MRTESLDDDRLRVYHLDVTRTLSGDAGDTNVPIVEVRTGSSRPGLLTDGTRAVVLLRPAPPLSYLTQQLPEGSRFTLAGGRDGIIPITADAQRAAIDATVAEARRIAALTDQVETTSARRALAFAELASTQPRLADDARAELGGLDLVTPLTDDEVQVLARVLASSELAAATRIGLIRLVGARGWKEALPALRSARADQPQVVNALFATRAQLGSPPTEAEIQPLLASKDNAVRAAAVRALGSLPNPAVAQLGRFATGDADVGVRVAAIEALGTTKQDAAVPPLSQTFGDSRRDVQQASGRALLAIGGPKASDAFVSLALHGADANTRKYAALLLVVSTGNESPGVRRVLAANPSGEVREVIEHGLQWQHSHQHEAE